MASFLCLASRSVWNLFQVMVWSEALIWIFSQGGGFSSTCSGKLRALCLPIGDTSPRPTSALLGAFSCVPAIARRFSPVGYCPIAVSLLHV